MILVLIWHNIRFSIKKKVSRKNGKFEKSGSFVPRTASAMFLFPSAPEKASGWDSGCPAMTLDLRSKFLLQQKILLLIE